MVTRSKRKRRLWDGYAFPGFRPQATVRGVFGDPKARVITLTRRSKKHSVEPAERSTRVGTTGSGGRSSTLARTAGVAYPRVL
ncbi:MAG: hypothetical protein ACREQA_19190 [Candidatus Binatia bacterium]